jgi:hypothetical protein
VGSGKTKLLLEIGEELEARDTPHALVDLDWLAWVRPARGARLTVHEILVANLAAAWRTFRSVGVERLVLARYIERQDQLATLRRALTDVDLFVVRVAAPLPVIEERLRARDTGAELAEHLAEAEAAAAAAAEPAFEDAVVDNGGRPAREVALDVLSAAAWL